MRIFGKEVGTPALIGIAVGVVALGVGIWYLVTKNKNDKDDTTVGGQVSGKVGPVSGQVGGSVKINTKQGITVPGVGMVYSN